MFLAKTQTKRLIFPPCRSYHSSSSSFKNNTLPGSFKNHYSSHSHQQQQRNRIPIDQEYNRRGSAKSVSSNNRILRDRFASVNDNGIQRHNGSPHFKRISNSLKSSYNPNNHDNQNQHQLSYRCNTLPNSKYQAPEPTVSKFSLGSPNQQIPATGISITHIDLLERLGLCSTSNSRESFKKRVFFSY